MPGSNSAAEFASMPQPLSSIINLLRDRKAQRFAIFGGLGCLLAALIGELLLAATHSPPPTTPSTSLCLVIDCSGSMLIDDGRGENRLNKLQQVKLAASQFVTRQDLARNRLAVIGFGSSVHRATALTTDAEKLRLAIGGIADGGGTDIAAALAEAAAEFHAGANNPVVDSKAKTILLFTDGQPDDEAAAVTVASDCRERGIRIVAIGTGDADARYLAQLTGDPALVFSVRSGKFDEGFKQAETVLRGGSLVESSPTENDFGRSLLLILGWTALLACGTSLALIIGQNVYLQRPILSSQEFLIGSLGGLGAGLIAGAAGQVLFSAAAAMSHSSIAGEHLAPMMVGIGRVVAWALLGALTARGLALFVPNLRPRYAWVGGSVGGAIAAVAFIGASFSGDLVGRLLGATILGALIGAMITLAEVASRQAWLDIRFGASEVVRITLGSDPVKVGSDSNACAVYARGARPLALAYRLVNGEVECVDYALEKTTVVPPDSECKVGNVHVTVRTSPYAASGAASDVAVPQPSGRRGAPPPPPPSKTAETSSPSSSPRSGINGTSSTVRPESPTSVHPAKGSPPRPLPPPPKPNPKTTPAEGTETATQIPKPPSNRLGTTFKTIRPVPPGEPD